MKKKLRIAVVELYPQRAIYIKKLFKKTKYSKTLYMKVFPIYKKANFPDNSFNGIIYTGGDLYLSEKRKYPYLVKLIKQTKYYANKVPILGICLGHQLIADTFKGKLKQGKTEVGFVKIDIDKKNDLTKGLPKQVYFFNYHETSVFKLPQDFTNFASSKDCKIHLMKHKNKPIYGIQFHPEIDKNTSIKAFRYLEEDLLEEGFDIKKLIKGIKHYSEKNSIKIFENFIKIILKEEKLK